MINTINPVLTILRWLPVHKRIMFKTVMLEWKCRNGTALVYLSELCIPVASGSQDSLDGSTTNSQNPNHNRPAELTVTEQSLWNSLPAALQRLEMTLHTFKIYLFESDVPTKRTNIHHRQALSWHFSWFWLWMRNCWLTYLVHQCQICVSLCWKVLTELNNWLMSPLVTNSPILNITHHVFYHSAIHLRNGRTYFHMCTCQILQKQ